MRTNKTMRIASLILVAVMLTTCAISGTFAKYVTSDEASDSARVAKWGVEVVATSEAFADAYTNEKTTWAATSATYTADPTVKADTQGTKIVAPGTKGTLGSFAITGTPEVDVKIDYSIKLELGANWVGDADGTYYCPLVITVGTTEYDGNDYDNADAFEAAVEDAIATALGMTAINSGAGTYTKNVNANQNLATTGVAGNVTVQWEWPYETGADSTEIAANDILDTYLGDQAAANNAATVAFEIIGTVTQID